MAAKKKTPRKPRTRKFQLYDAPGQPAVGFNKAIYGWLTGEMVVMEHSPPMAFGAHRLAYDASVAAIMRTGASKLEAHKKALSNLTALLFSIDNNTEMAARLASAPINPTGFRSTLSQGMAKNAGENFINTIVYALSDILADQNDVLVDKGCPPLLKKFLTVKRRFNGKNGTSRDLDLKIEVDFCIFSKADPLNAIIVSGKTRLKEVFHIGTMWKLFFDMIGDPHCMEKWGLQSEELGEQKLIYAFATADMIAEGGRKTQGPDVGPDGVRNLLALDASFFDYVFVSKTYPTTATHVSPTLDLAAGREALFHQMGCLLDLVQQKFNLRLS